MLELVENYVAQLRMRQSEALRTQTAADPLCFSANTIAEHEEAISVQAAASTTSQLRKATLCTTKVMVGA